MSEKFSLKDHLFNEQKIKKIATEIQSVYPEFETLAFEKAVLAAFPYLELKARISHIRKCLHEFLPLDYRQAVNILLKSLPKPLDETLTDNDFGDFIYASYSDFIANYGCNPEYLSFSLQGLYLITQRFSAEYAIRDFLNAFPEETFATILCWTESPNYHVRRLCSEGTRPSLPWASKISLEPEQSLIVLSRLYTDKTRFVTRSVANHLNDISKTNPNLVLQILSVWSLSGLQNIDEMKYIMKHALRTLVKTGNQEALKVLGFGNSEGIKLTDLQNSPFLKIGESLTFSFTITSESPKSIAIDYLIYFRNKQGTLSNKKIFKLKTFECTKPLESIMVSKRHLFRAGMTTRTLYSGPHNVEIQLNGKILANFTFELMGND